MNTRQVTITLLTTGLLVLMVPGILLADEPVAKAKVKDSTVVIIGDDGEETVIDMGEVHGLVAEAMEGLDEVMAELDDMQFQMRLGHDNRLDLSYDDTTIEVDLDQIMTQVAAAVQMGLEELDSGEWTRHHDRNHGVSEDDLRQELADLKEEMEALRLELQNLRRDDGD